MTMKTFWPNSKRKLLFPFSRSSPFLYNNTQDYPKAVALLNYALEEAEAADLKHLFGEIYVALHVFIAN